MKGRDGKAMMDDSTAAREISESIYGASMGRVGKTYLVRGVSGASLITVRDGRVKISAGFLPIGDFSIFSVPRNRLGRRVRDLIQPILFAAADLRQRAAELALAPIRGEDLDPSTIPAPRYFR